MELPCRPSQQVVQIRVEAARLVRALCNGSDLTLQTLISCGGLAVLAQFLGAGSRIDGPGTVGADARRLVRIGIDGVLHVFSLQVRGARSEAFWIGRGGMEGYRGKVVVEEVIG